MAEQHQGRNSGQLIADPSSKELSGYGLAGAGTSTKETSGFGSEKHNRTEAVEQDQDFGISNSIIEPRFGSSLVSR